MKKQQITNLITSRQWVTYTAAVRKTTKGDRTSYGINIVVLNKSTDDTTVCLSLFSFLMKQVFGSAKSKAFSLDSLLGTLGHTSGNLLKKFTKNQLVIAKLIIMLLAKLTSLLLLWRTVRMLSDANHFCPFITRLWGGSWLTPGASADHTVTTPLGSSFIWRWNLWVVSMSPETRVRVHPERETS